MEKENKENCTAKKCCCKCESQFKVMKHPSNKGIARSSISEQLGYICFLIFDGEPTVIFFNKAHGECELFKEKIKSALLEGAVA